VADDPESDGVIRLPVTEELDLHAFAPRDVPSVVEEYLRACREEGLTLVRLVHGRGRGVQRAEVRRVLRRMTAEVESFGDAPPASGGWGATLVRLRPREDSRGPSRE
jgi:DNA-nicking Smr family endonuclease